jgi:hypothetical protein
MDEGRAGEVKNHFHFKRRRRRRRKRKKKEEKRGGGGFVYIQRYINP